MIIIEYLKSHNYYSTNNGVLLHGDTIEWMSKIKDKSIDLILCDLPYGTTACKWDSIISMNDYIPIKIKNKIINMSKEEFILHNIMKLKNNNIKQIEKEWEMNHKEGLWTYYNRIIKDSGVILLTASQPFSSKLVMSNPKMFKYEWIWEKDQGRNFQLAKKQPLKITESILVFYKKFSTYNPQGLKKLENPIIKSNNKKGGRLGHLSSESKRSTYIQEYTNYPKNLIKFNSERGYHPTQKPVELIKYLIKTYSNENDLILDNTSGSGTLAVACEQLGNRKWICIEKEKEYCDITVKRLKELEFVNT